MGLLPPPPPPQSVRTQIMLLLINKTQLLHFARNISCRIVKFGIMLVLNANNCFSIDINVRPLRRSCVGVTNSLCIQLINWELKRGRNIASSTADNSVDCNRLCLMNLITDCQYWLSTTKHPEISIPWNVVWRAIWGIRKRKYSQML